MQKVCLSKRKVTLVVAHYSWFGKRPWDEPTLSVPIITRILKPVVDLTVVDANADKLTVEETKSRIAEINPEIVLITALSAEYYKAYHTIAKIAKEINTECVVIMGGVYPTVLAEDVIKDHNVDYAMIGYAEERLDKLVSYIFQKDMEAIYRFEGIAYRQGEKEVINPMTSFIGDVKKMVQPDYSLVDLEKYIGSQDVNVSNFVASSNKRNNRGNITEGTSSMDNDYLEYYGKYSISPVTQDLTDFGLHIERRKKLYRQCGISTLAFRNAELLEVGTGGGYNTLAFFQWNVKHADLVEANQQGIKDMQKLFTEYNVPYDKYSIFENRIENYNTNKKYDIVIAEGFLPYIYNQKEIIGKLQGLVSSGGIIVITCTDDVCMFIEAMKRLVGVTISADIKEFGKKVEFLTAFFEPQLNRLRGVSRNAKEWVQDQILNPAGINGMELSLIQAMEYFDNDFDILGSSPCMFTDYSWYKDIWYDYKEDYKEQFRKKRLNLLLTDMREVVVPLDAVDALTNNFRNIKRLAAEYEKTLEMEKIGQIIKVMNAMYDMASTYLDDGFMKIFMELKGLLRCIQQNGLVEMDRYPHFFEAFGRTQQYISFVRK